MKKVLRSIVHTKTEEKEAATENLGQLETEMFLLPKKAELDILVHVIDFYQRQAEAPQLQSVIDHFELAKDPEAITLLEEVTTENFYSVGPFDEGLAHLHPDGCDLVRLS